MGRRTWAAVVTAAAFLCWTPSASAAPKLLRLLDAKRPIAQLSVSGSRLYWQVDNSEFSVLVKAKLLPHGDVLTLGDDTVCGAFCEVAIASTEGRAWWEVFSGGSRERDGDIFTAATSRDERHVLSEGEDCVSAPSSPVARSGVALLTVFRLDAGCNDRVVGGTVYAASVDAPAKLRRMNAVPVPAVLGTARDSSLRNVLGLATAGGRLAVIPNPLGRVPATVTVQVRSVSTGAAVTSFDVTGRVRSMAMTRRYVVLAVRVHKGDWQIQWYDAGSGALAGTHAVRPRISPISAFGPRVVYSRHRQVRLLDLDTNTGARLWTCQHPPQDVQISDRLVAWVPRARSFGTPGHVVGVLVPRQKR